MTTRKTLKDFFQSRQSIQSSISLNPTDINNNGDLEQGVDDLGADFESGEQLLDLDEKTTGLLGDYVSFIMSSYDHKNGTYNGKISNFYRPGPKNSRSPSSDRGNRSHDPVGPDGNAKVFVESNTSLGLTLRKYSNSGYIENLDSIVKKEGDPANNDILKFDSSKIKNTGQTFSNQQINQDSVRETLEAIKGNNRYNPGQINDQGLAYAENQVTDSELTGENRVEIYDGLGENEPINSEIKISNLFKLVPDILVKHTGIDPAVFSSKTKEEIFEYIENNENTKPKTKDVKANIQDSLPDEVKNSGYQKNKNDILLDERNIEFQKGDYSDFTYADPDYTIFLGAIRLKIVLSLIVDRFSQEDINVEDSKSGYVKKTRGASRIPYIIDTLYPLIECVDEGISVMFGNKAVFSDLKLEDVAKSSKIIESKYFWIPMFKSVIKDSDRLLNIVENTNTQDFLKQLSISRIAQMTNILAYIGDLSLRSTEGLGISGIKEVSKKESNVLNVDKKNESLANVISKNKNSDGKIAWNQGSTPSMYLMPGNVPRAAMNLGTGVRGTNPLKSALSERLSSQTLVSPLEGDFARIPTSLVEKLENELEASYVPFYFHDIRTNEIISFHAFLEQLSDAFSPSYNPSSGYGRMDPVQIYKGTTRSINISFYIAATSKKDFNEMWWKVNKLVTLVYPQWSKGTKVFDEVGGGNIFIQPFSQVITASPMIRLRVGDLIKSNYSELALARQFGIGNVDTNILGRPGIAPSATDINNPIAVATRRALKEIQNLSIMVLFGSPVAWSQFGSNLTELVLRSVGSKVTDRIATGMFDTQGSKIVEKLGIHAMKNQNSLGQKSLYNKFINPNLASSSKSQDYGPKTGNKVILGATLPDFPYYSSSDERYYHINRSVIGEVVERQVIEDEIYFKIKIVDINATNLIGKNILARFEDFILSPEHMFLDVFSETLSSLTDLFSAEDFVDDHLTSEFGKLGMLEDEVNLFKLLMAESSFMSPFARQDAGGLSPNSKIPTGNPFTRAFNSSKGRGLAGFVNSLTFEMLGENNTWEIDFNSRAPKLIKVSMGFNPVHDIPPGLDHSGFNRAPIYNVGDIMRSTSGDPWSSRGSFAEAGFKKGNTDDE